MLDHLLIAITDLGPALAYGAIFAILVVCGLGLPLPEDIPLIAAGVLVSDGTLTLTGALTVTVSGVLIGDMIVYWLGRRFGVSFVDQGRLPGLNHERVVSVKGWFGRFGAWVVFGARFIMGLRFAVFFLSGAFHLKFWKFIALDSAAACLSVPLWILLGRWIGDRFGDDLGAGLHFLKPYKNAIGLTTLGLILVAGVVVFLRIRSQDQLRRKLEIQGALKD